MGTEESVVVLMSDEQLTHEEILAFGKMCGCGECRFCHAYEQERIWKKMVKEVKRGKEVAEKHREEIKKGWLWK